MTLAGSPRRSPALFVALTMCLFISNAQQGRRGVGPDTLPGMEQPLLYRYPVISPGGMALAQRWGGRGCF